MVRFLPSRWLCLGCLGGLFLALPFWWKPCGPLAILGAAMWALSVDARIQQKWMLTSWMSIVFFFGSVFLWVGAIHPVAPIVLAAYGGLYFLCGAWVYRKLLRWGLAAWIALPLIWVATEHAYRTVSFFPTSWMHLGYTLLAWNPAVQTADLWGVAGLTFLITITAGLLCDWGLRLQASVLSVPRSPWIGSFVVVLLWGAALTYGISRPGSLEMGETLEVVLVQGNTPMEQKNDPKNRISMFNHHMELTREGVTANSDFVVWPETSASVFIDPEREGFWQKELAQLSNELGIPILVGGIGVIRDGGESRGTNSVYVFEPGKGLTDRYDKVRLVPFGEFVPIVEWFPTEVQNKVYRWAQEQFGVYPYLLPGAEPDPVSFRHEETSIRLGVLICYEDVMPALTSRFVRRGADVLVNPSNEAWFYSIEMDQHVAIARLRSIENRRPMVRATNTGLTVIIDPLGQETARLTVDGQSREISGTLSGTVQLSREQTLISRHGPWFSRLCLAVCLGLLLSSFFPGQLRKIPELPGPTVSKDTGSETQAVLEIEPTELATSQTSLETSDSSEDSASP